LTGCGLADLASRPVADDDLDRRGERGEAQGHDEPGAVVLVAPALEVGPGVDAGDDEPGDDVAREVHVHHLVPQVGVEHRLPRARVGDLAVDHVEALRIVHPRVDREDEERPREARDDDRYPGQEVHAAREPVPAVDVDRDEDRLDEERDPLQAEGDAEDLAPGGHELRPEQAELEGEDRARDDPDGEEDERDLRPALGQGLVGRVARAEVEALDEEDHRREGDPEAHDRDVHAERERLHLAGLEPVGLTAAPERLDDALGHEDHVRPRHPGNVLTPAGRGATNPDLHGGTVGFLTLEPAADAPTSAAAPGVRPAGQGPDGL
jgi:hypothetical protein